MNKSSRCGAEQSLIEELQGIVGIDHVLTNSSDFAARLIDNRNRYCGTASCAVLPCSTAEVAKVMKTAARHHANVFTQGGNTSNVGGAAAVPDEAHRDNPSILLVLERMRSIESIDPVNDTAVVQAGVVLANLQEAARRHGRLFPVSLAAEGSCTIGGILATNAGGVHVLFYGNTREQCLGLEAVLADGRVLNLMRGLRKDNTGYDLKDLFIGSEGTLGVITRAVMKLSPLPSERIVVFIGLACTEALTEAFSAFEQSFCESLTAFEVMHHDTVAHVADVWSEVTRGLNLSAPWFALAEISLGADSRSERAQSDLEETLGTLFESGAVIDAVVGQSEAQNAALWRVRESIPDAHKKTGGNVKHDVSVPRSALPQFIEHTNALLKARFPWIAPSVFGHFGDGNLHYNMGVCKGFDPKLCFVHENEIHAMVYAEVARLAGSVAAEHGIGRMKHELLREVKSPEEYAVMRRIKAVFDPEGRLNPGALVAPE